MRLRQLVSGPRTDLDEPLEVVLAEQDVLGVDPADRRREVVRERLDQDDVGEPLAVLVGAPVVLIALPQDLVQGW